MPRIREFRWGRWASFAHAAFWLDKPSVIAIDTETEGLGFYDQPFAATVTWRTPAGELTSWYFELADPEVQSDLRNILRNAPTWVGHNLKFDLQKMRLAGLVTDQMLEGRELHDTQILYHLLDENGRKGLKHLAVTVLGYDETIEVEVKSGPNKGTTKRVPKQEHHLNAVRRKLKLTKDDPWSLLPREVLIPYALMDTEFTLRLYETLRPKVEALGEDVWAWYQTEIELTRTLLAIEEEGMALDVEYLETTASEYGVRVMEGQAKIAQLTGNPDLNPNAPQQLLKAFAERGLNLETTAVAELKGLDDELAVAVLAYRDDLKLYKTYLRGLLSEQRDGVAHPNFNQTGARTGRMSSGSAAQ